MCVSISLKRNGQMDGWPDSQSDRERVPPCVSACMIMQMTQNLGNYIRKQADAWPILSYSFQKAKKAKERIRILNLYPYDITFIYLYKSSVIVYLVVQRLSSSLSFKSKCRSPKGYKYYAYACELNNI